MVVQRFCRAYMESPPPAVFHYKYQSYKYERNTAGKSATLGVERDFVFYQEFLIPGAPVGILDCTHFSEWFGYNHTR